MLVALLGSKGVVELVDTEFNARLRDNPRKERHVWLADPGSISFLETRA
jgi:hypothetical protein